MSISVSGQQYICENFGNASLCCVKTGLSWKYRVSGIDYTESGGTAQIVSRLASGLIDYLTMLNPIRGNFSKAQLDTANGSTVQLTDAMTITLHDEPSEDQWCFITCSTHTDMNTCENIYDCYWYNNSCHDTPPICNAIINEFDCDKYGCYWYNYSCHAEFTCGSITNATDCVAYGCYWYNGTCNAAAPACTTLNNSSDCLAYGCYWYNNSCHSSAVCEDINNEADCTAQGCHWYNGACHSSWSCPSMTNEPDCLGYGCYWYRGECHGIDQPELCYYVDIAWPIDITTVFGIVDSFVFQSPPTGGWAFVPSITEVFGIVDYYLGFNGDSKTGCDIGLFV